MLMDHEVQEHLWSSIQEAFQNVLVEVKTSSLFILSFKLLYIYKMVLIILTNGRKDVNESTN